MLSLANLRRLRISRDVPRPVIAALTAINPERLRTIELRAVEPWFDEALAISRVLGTDGIIPLIIPGHGDTGPITSGNLTTSGVDTGLATEHDIPIWRSGKRAPLSLAIRVAARLGLHDPADLAVTPLQRQIWDILQATERHPEAPGWCAWCGADIVDSRPHGEACLPHVLYAPHELPDTIRPLRPLHKGARELGIRAYGLRALRERHNMRQTDMAGQLQLNPNYYARLERADLPLTPKLARRISELFQVEMASIYAAPEVVRLPDMDGGS